MSENQSRKNIRLKNFNYASGRYYFITICCYKQKSFFGKIQKEDMTLNSFGQIAYQEWLNMHEKRVNLKLDKFIIMPNHMHGIINSDAMTGEASLALTNVLGNIIGGYKSAVTKEINKRIGDINKTEVWQRSYWDRVIRNETELYEIRNYIKNNPLSWELDKYYS